MDPQEVLDLTRDLDQAYSWAENAMLKIGDALRENDPGWEALEQAQEHVNESLIKLVNARATLHDLLVTAEEILARQE